MSRSLFSAGAVAWKLCYSPDHPSPHASSPTVKCVCSVAGRLLINRPPRLRNESGCVFQPCRYSFTAPIIVLCISFASWLKAAVGDAVLSNAAGGPRCTARRTLSRVQDTAAVVASASQACGSTPFILAVTIRLYMAAARWPNNLSITRLTSSPDEIFHVRRDTVIRIPFATAPDTTWRMARSTRTWSGSLRASSSVSIAFNARAPSQRRLAGPDKMCLCRSCPRLK